MIVEYWCSTAKPGLYFCSVAVAHSANSPIQSERFFWKVSQRDREIFLEFDGRNHHELARKFGVSLQWVYSVVKRVRKEELDRMQGKLFDGEPDADTGRKE